MRTHWTSHHLSRDSWWIAIGLSAVAATATYAHSPFARAESSNRIASCLGRCELRQGRSDRW